MHSRQPSTTAHTPVLPSIEPDPLPPPETFDFLPLLHVLLRRISVPSGAPLPNLDGTGGVEGVEAASSADSSDKVWDLKSHLDIKNLGPAVSHVKKPSHSSDHLNTLGISFTAPVHLALRLW
ncbi:hypothetical protein BLS_004504 [Venturia inaequalis]|uniref:Uncharacterized protein n=1 Tax=Venturia inaequalis TaxID=5025 RepID=A0A8H3Z596_VENIN|nr:hypothetical protein BLS_004504 [Venturia inaequalis]